LVYQIDQGITRLLWVGKERTIESFQGFFTVFGEQWRRRSGSFYRHPSLGVNEELPWIENVLARHSCNVVAKK
jgi:hypothetical protein